MSDARERAVWIAGNWKMHTRGSSAEALAAGILSGLPGTSLQVALFPPFVYLERVGRILRGSSVLLGAQDCADEEEGAYTGEVSAAQLADVGCRAVLIGHSERRRYQRERDAELALKLVQAQRHRLVPLFCVGETLEERKAGVTESVVTHQLEKGLGSLSPGAPLCIAYEPVWAIGTGVTATPEEAGAVHRFIRRWLSERLGQTAAATPVLYGGSVTPENARGLFSVPEIDGALVGGASLAPESFLSILGSALEQKFGGERASGGRT